MSDIDTTALYGAGLSIAVLKAEYLDLTLSKDDARLTRCLLGALAYAGQYTGRRLTRTGTLDEPVTLTVHLAGRRYVTVPEAIALADVTVSGQSVTRTHFYAPDGSTVEMLELAAEAESVALTGVFGLAPLPADLQDAVYLLAARRFVERNAIAGPTVEYADGGGQLTFVRSLPPAVMAALNAWKRNTAVVL